MNKIISVLLLSVLAVPQAFASCTQKNLTGTWAIFAATNNWDFSGAGKGAVVVLSTGVVDAKKSSLVIRVVLLNNTI